MQVETKFNPKDEVFFLKDSKVLNFPVHSIQISVEPNKETRTEYYVKIHKSENDYSFELLKESECFASREELIAQL